MSNLKEKLLNAFDNPVYDTFTVAQAAARYRVAPSSVTKAVNVLRKEGYPIYTNRKNYEGRQISVYRLGTPSKRFLKAQKKKDTAGMIAALTGR